MLNPKYLLFLVTITITAFHSLSFANDHSLYKTLDDYGFKEESQKKSLENLMHYANILEKDQKFDERYPSRNSPDELLKDSLDFVKQTQQHFFTRKNVQERWEMQKPTSWIESNNFIIVTFKIGRAHV